MKTIEVFELQKGDRINHKHYGICQVDSTIPEFGVCIIPESEESLTLLSRQLGMPIGTPLLETSFRLITGKIN
ncbi:MAG: hypothetical protein A2W90_18155 [Bacteroidetes bacterium GWF2_42_66]|nr:MAG: hypothetical protein A2W92_06145 [Bacteroidetes bacterium GWA2_42_15]OFX98176.1 MAG: hypothetical protein A2W89_09645 [Bacteroidetes bacterium GWE2_42_39]OFY42561.1 MAG: hypothetical protein A2W90_18155 [Bacteroidetes bacterium GWF2_42_66]HBL74277.1 hypothetical protein [Prolixibacteraceae bacterium]HCU64046.1 hypothetical protein [Prolixibacteraceae bacterium]